MQCIHESRFHVGCLFLLTDNTFSPLSTSYPPSFKSQKTPPLWAERFRCLLRVSENKKIDRYMWFRFTGRCETLGRSLFVYVYLLLAYTHNINAPSRQNSEICLRDHFWALFQKQELRSLINRTKMPYWWLSVSLMSRVLMYLLYS